MIGLTMVGNKHIMYVGLTYQGIITIFTVALETPLKVAETTTAAQHDPKIIAAPAN